MVFLASLEERRPFLSFMSVSSCVAALIISVASTGEVGAAGGNDESFTAGGSAQVGPNGNKVQRDGQKLGKLTL